MVRKSVIDKKLHFFFLKFFLLFIGSGFNILQARRKNSRSDLIHTLSVYVCLVLFCVCCIFKNTNICQILHTPRGLFVFFTPFVEAQNPTLIILLSACTRQSHYETLRGITSKQRLAGQQHGLLICRQQRTHFFQMTPENKTQPGIIKKKKKTQQQVYMCMYLDSVAALLGTPCVQCKFLLIFSRYRSMCFLRILWYMFCLLWGGLLKPSIHLLQLQAPRVNFRTHQRESSLTPAASAGEWMWTVIFFFFQWAFSSSTNP